MPLFVRPVGEDHTGLRVDEGADAAGAEIVDNAVVLAHTECGVKEPHLGLPVFAFDDSSGNTERVHRLRMDDRHLRPLIDDLLQHCPLLVDGGKGFLNGVIIFDAVKMNALAESGVNGLYDIVRVLVRKLSELLHGLLGDLVPVAYTDHVTLEHVPELLVGQILVLQHIGVFGVVHPGIVAQAYAFGDEGIAVSVILPLKAKVEILVVIGAVLLQAVIHVPAESAHIFLIRHLLRCFVAGDDLVDPALVAATVVIFAVPVFEADLVVYFSPEFTEHRTHTLLSVRNSTFFAVYSTNLLPANCRQ